ncbi:DUF4230 domain-containing protein [Neobacillus niacini]|uniref:DUF4230 domain-containing protein n=1 Tax=Neobacillus niacini TaxID=86668 RepID=UPI002858AAD7|nr:DUF4230 domain-containing protein [Neobacillus niacini]MDR7001593.1 hypothetical protein [Neobacillus niacini]
MIKKAAKGTLMVASLAVAGGLYVNTVFDPGAKPIPVEKASAHYVDKQAVINALSTKAELVGLTGKVAKTIEYNDSEWYGDKTYKLAATGTFKLGIQTADIQVTTHGNTVTVKFPQPKIISVDIPFDKARVSKDVGMFRKDLNEAQLQAMFGKARTGAIDDIKRNRQAFDKAEASVERTIEALIKPVENVKHIEFMEAK